MNQDQTPRTPESPRRRSRFGAPVVIVLALAAVANGQEAPSADAVQSPIISYFNIGGSSKNADDHYIGWSLRQIGWRGFVDRYIKPQIRLGVRRFQLHNPFGFSRAEKMEFDQFLDARADNLHWAYEDFVEVWAPLIRGDGGSPPIEVIAYLGNPERNELMQRHLRDGRSGLWTKRAMESLDLPLRAGMSIGFDAIVGTPADHPAYSLAETLRLTGVRVYVESRPPKKHPHWHDYHVIAMDRMWRGSDPVYGHPKAKRWATPEHQLTGEIVRILRPGPHEWENNAAAVAGSIDRILGDGHTACVSVYYFLKEGGSLDRWLPQD